MITTKHKHDIVSLIERESSNLGSYTKVAAKLGVSNAYITEIRKPERWFKFPDKAWSDIAGMLNYRVDSEKWQIADITNFQWLTAALENAKQDSMCIGISEKAGSGKTKSLESFLKNDTTSGVFLIRCEAWGYRVFLEKVCREVGIKLSEKRHTCEDMLEQIIAFFASVLRQQNLS
ncbi:hypothetical protein ACFFJX_08260 [Pseudarcicella hirudinis]|uniref:hypothetical protein n=1 Tax=Pseudarcicella hirudinis TaxID=1079859 RepID=UPI0035F0E4B6